MMDRSAPSPTPGGPGPPRRPDRRVLHRLVRRLVRCLVRVGRSLLPRSLRRERSRVEDQLEGLDPEQRERLAKNLRALVNPKAV